jgi:hypothetical protein
MEAAENRVQAALGKGVSFAVSLSGGGNENDPFAPGKNGPFEDIFRAMDVAKLGAASPWAEKLGLTQAEAARISADFQRGLFSEGVQGLRQATFILSLDAAAEDQAAVCGWRQAGRGRRVCSPLDYGTGDGRCAPPSGGSATQIVNIGAQRREHPGRSQQAGRGDLQGTGDGGKPDRAAGPGAGTGSALTCRRDSER